MMFNSIQTVGGEPPQPAAQAARYTPRTYTITSQCLDAQETDRLGAIFDDLADEGRNVILDMRNVEFMDSAGLGLIKSLLQSLNRRERKLQVIKLQIQPKHVLAMVRLSHLINAS
jgi:anti-anti-sigma factor